jgi:hypothetical protein
MLSFSTTLGYIMIWLLLWILIGMLVVRFWSNGAGGWLVMIADRRNVKHTWLAIPALFLTWLLWPIRTWVARQCFLFALKA